MKYIFDNIRTARKAAKKSQQEMADILKVNRSTYSNWELNTIPDVLTLIKIGEVLNVDWTSFVKGTVVGEPIQNKSGGAYEIMRIKENTDAILRKLDELEARMSSGK